MSLCGMRPAAGDSGQSEVSVCQSVHGSVCHARAKWSSKRRTLASNSLKYLHVATGRQVWNQSRSIYRQAVSTRAVALSVCIVLHGSRT
jgi:hypothetical protein